MKVFCILSDQRAMKSRSPFLHTSVLNHLGINGVYVPFSVDSQNIGNAVHGLRALNIAGANVTVPYKETVIPYLDNLSEEAAAIGAVNTIVIKGETLTGHNTDATGFMESLHELGLDLKNSTVLVFGTGGAAKAINVALKRLALGKILITGRDISKAKALADRCGAIAVSLDGLLSTTTHADLVVNATSISSIEESNTFAESVKRISLTGCNYVVDINYGRKSNFWRDLAGEHGASFMDGLPMLANQARHSFHLWTGIEVDAKLFQDFLMEKI